MHRDTIPRPSTKHRTVSQKGSDSECWHHASQHAHACHIVIKQRALASCSCRRRKLCYLMNGAVLSRGLDSRLSVLPL